jgi:hypothetical protein
MTRIVAVFLATILTALPACAGSAHPSKKRAPKSSAKAHSEIDCTKYGPGFVKMGSETCVKIGGGIDVDAGRGGK